MRLLCLGVIALAGCRAAETEADARIRKIAAQTSYDHRGAEGHENAHIPAHDPAEMVRLFERSGGRLGKAGRALTNRLHYWLVELA